jgi:hypothetical protein
MAKERRADGGQSKPAAFRPNFFGNFSADENFFER